MKKSISLIFLVAVFIFVVTASYYQDEERIASRHTTEAVKIEKNLKYPARKLPVELEAERTRLTQENQKIYDEYLLKILNYEPFIVDFEENEKDFTREDFYDIIWAIYEDYPETYLFVYTEENEWYDSGDAINIDVFYKYKWMYSESFSKHFMDSYLKRIDNVCNELLADMPDNLDLAGKYEYIARKLCAAVRYQEYDYDLNSTEYDISYSYLNGPLLHGDAICQSYAFAYEYLCHRAGLWCVTVESTDHMWNLVRLEDGSTYHIDVTWCDDEIYGFTKFYFLLTQEQIETDHYPMDGTWIATGEAL